MLRAMPFPSERFRLVLIDTGDSFANEDGSFSHSDDDESRSSSSDDEDPV